MKTQSLWKRVAPTRFRFLIPASACPTNAHSYDRKVLMLQFLIVHSGAGLDTQISVIEVMRYVQGKKTGYATTSGRAPVWTKPRYGSIGWKHTIKTLGQNEDDRKLVEQAQEGGN